MELEETLQRIEAFYEAARKMEGFVGYDAALAPATGEQIALLTETYRVHVPEDVHRFWKRGLKYATLHVGTAASGDSASAYFDWSPVDDIGEQVTMLRESAPLCDGDERRLLETGLPLTNSPPQLVIDWNGGIRHYSTENGLELPVTSSFVEFLEHWLEAGCFSSNRLEAYLTKVRPILPGRIPPERNLWVAYYRRVFAKYV